MGNSPGALNGDTMLHADPSESVTHDWDPWPLVWKVLVSIGVLALVAQVLVDPLEPWTGHLRSEYQPHEVGTKWLLLLTFSVAALALWEAKGRREEALSLAWVMLAGCMYLFESNFVYTYVQVVVAVPILVYIFYTGLKEKARERGGQRARGPLALLFTGGVFLGLGFAADIVDDLSRHGLSPSFLEERFFGVFASFEEVYELLGVLFGGLSASAALLPRVAAIRPTSSKRPSLPWTAPWLALFLAGTLLIATGNSLLHHQYRPETWLQLTGYILSSVGVIATFLVTQRYPCPPHRRIGHGGAGAFFFSFGLFLVLPTVYGQVSSVLTVLLWLPVFVMVPFFVLRRWPARTRDDDFMNAPPRGVCENRHTLRSSSSSGG